MLIYEKSNQDKYICTKPFSWLEIGKSGECFVCCRSWLDKPIGNLSKQPIDDVWNSKDAQEIRESMFDGSFKYCNDLCPFKNTKTGPVVQIYDLFNSQPKFKEIYSNKITKLPFGPRAINASYDRSCNLSCPSCRTKVIVELGKQQILKIQDKMLELLKKDTEWLCITGSGDPFGSPAFKKLLRELEPNEYPNLKSIHLHTNGVLWEKTMWDTMDKIHPLVKSAEISIDAATEETYKINRRGGDWNKLLTNLNWISNLNISLKISFVVQQNNYKEMIKFIELGEKLKVKTVYFSKLVQWGTFTEKEYEERCVHKVTHPEYSDLTNIIKQIKNRINSVEVLLGNLNDLSN